jgi:hypothetical protein
LALRTAGDPLKNMTKWHLSTAHSAPIYVVVKDSIPLASQPRAKRTAKAWLTKLNALETLLDDEHIDFLANLHVPGDPVPNDLLVRNKHALLEEIEKAKLFFKTFK